jgi:hypothetical protein
VPAGNPFSDEQAEYQVRDRFSFTRFLRLGIETAFRTLFGLQHAPPRHAGADGCGRRPEVVQQFSRNRYLACPTGLKAPFDRKGQFVGLSNAAPKLAADRSQSGEDHNAYAERLWHEHVWAVTGDELKYTNPSSGAGGRTEAV